MTNVLRSAVQLFSIQWPVKGKSYKLRGKVMSSQTEWLGMPQIWVTYDELAELLDCDRDTARAAATAIRLDRRRSRDGHTRAKLSATLTEALLDALTRQRLEREIGAAIGNLRSIGRRMARHSAGLPDAGTVAVDRIFRHAGSASHRFGTAD